MSSQICEYMGFAVHQFRNLIDIDYYPLVISSNLSSIIGILRPPPAVLYKSISLAVKVHCTSQYYSQ